MTEDNLTESGGIAGEDRALMPRGVPITVEMAKQCLHCAARIVRPKPESLAKWREHRYCSRSCFRKAYGAKAFRARVRTNRLDWVDPDII